MFNLASIFYETSSHVVLGKHQDIFEKVFDELKKTLWRVFCSPWWTDRYALAYWERRLGEFLSSLWRMKKSVKAYEANSKNLQNQPSQVSRRHNLLVYKFFMWSLGAFTKIHRFHIQSVNQNQGNLWSLWTFREGMKVHANELYFNCLKACETCEGRFATFLKNNENNMIFFILNIW